MIGRNKVIESLQELAYQETKEIFEVKVIECLLAEVFLKAGVGDYGYAAVCSDVLLTKLVNPQIILDLEGILM
jgi:hypothetical protein